MVAIILPTDAQRPWGRSQIELFQNIVTLYHKLKGIEHRAPCKHIILSLRTPSTCGLD